MDNYKFSFLIYIVFIIYYKFYNNICNNNEAYIFSLEIIEGLSDLKRASNLKNILLV